MRPVLGVKSMLGIALLACGMQGSVVMAHTEGTEVADPSSRAALLTLRTAVVGYTALESPTLTPWQVQPHGRVDASLRATATAGEAEEHHGHHGL